MPNEIRICTHNVNGRTKETLKLEQSARIFLKEKLDAMVVIDTRATEKTAEYMRWQFKSTLPGVSVVMFPTAVSTIGPRSLHDDVRGISIILS